MTDLQRLIADLRAQGITKTQMARVMETSMGNVNSWESGRTPRKPEYEQKLRAWMADREGDQHHALIKQPEPDVADEPDVVVEPDDSWMPADLPDAEETVAAIEDEDRADAVLQSIVTEYRFHGGGAHGMMKAAERAVYQENLSEDYLDPLAALLHAAQEGNPKLYTKSAVRDVLRRMLAESRTVEAEAEPEISEEDAEAASADLRANPDLLQRGVDLVHKMGVVGEHATIKGVLLASVSRLFSQPSNLLLIGEPGTGKSTVVENTLKLVPPDRVTIINNMSPRALAYSTFDFRRTVFFLSEGTPLADPNDDPAKSMLRTLISEGRIVYETVVTNDTGTPETVRLEKEGPISFITCHVEPFKEGQIASRLIEIATDQTADQTKQVLESIAAVAGGAEHDDLADEIAAWHALHIWLAYQPTRIVVPYAKAIADLYGSITNRSPRDLKQVLALTKASAMLHQASREVDDDGRVIATRDDYGHAYDALANGIDASAEVRPTGHVADLMAHLVAKALADKPKSGMPKRGALKVADSAVGQVVEYSQRALADAVGMPRTTCRRAVNQAIDAGYIHRRSTKLTATMQLEILHAPKSPNNGVGVLPSPERVQAVAEGKPDPAKASILKLTLKEEEGEGGTIE